MTVRGPTAWCIALAAALSEPAALAEVHLEIQPVFGESCLPRTGPAELVVTVDNPQAQAVTGALVIDEALPPANRVRTVRAVPVAVPGRSRVGVRIATASAVSGNGLVVRLVDPRGRALATSPLAFTRGADAALIDATQGARLALALHAAAVAEMGPGMPGAGFNNGVGAMVPRGPTACAARRSVETGEIVLPRTAEGYGNVALVLMDTCTLTTLPGRERAALADYVLGGGSLALVVTRPDDLRHPTAAALLGTGLSPAAPAAPPLRVTTIYYNPMNGTSGAQRPAPATLAGAVTWRSGHLHHRTLATILPWSSTEQLGATAEYGFGQVHVLSWNPARAPALDDPWSAHAVEQIAGLTDARRAQRLFAPTPDTTPVPAAVRAALTPVDAYRPGLGLALALLLAYGVLAGPASFLVLARRRGSLRALGLLPLWAAGAVALIADVGGRSRSALGRARTLAMVDLPAGFARGPVRRYHGYYAPDGGALSMSVQGPDRGLVADAACGRGFVTAFADAGGTRLVGLIPMAWVTTVAREEGYETLAGSVAIVPTDGGGIRVVNRLPHDLEDVVVVAPDGATVWSFRRLRAGEGREARSGRVMPADVAGRLQGHEVASLPRWGSPEAVRLAAGQAAHPGDERAWGARLAAYFGHPTRAQEWDAALALPSTPARRTPWTADDAPVLLARVDRRARAAQDGGLKVDRESLWVRVRGYGGAP